ncbi:DUF3048 domain-containing protein [Paenisporosarcina cavernae]|uniref:DUF3048 domain-containing protein n=1 Tax=Paenisporosarcina cavernae TaxID=2320858 RepID=A0A385YUR9_9BACL|nr:DUF3048 domain-containing protein [Paenisporosarcina cavernae]AYC30304.1 DUF3048 domain-containing protein [Paenisporosarcina cavernae]
MKKLGIGLFVVLLIATGCNKKEETEKPVVAPIEEEVVIDEPAAEEPEMLPYVEPFTGVRVENEPTTRPVLVTINNHPDARPQSGIADADMVYEMIAEGGVTRFLALFQSELPEEIGPVRSARDYFIEIAKGLDAFYVAHGYSPDAQRLLRAGVVDNINGMQYDGSLFTRSSERRAPHNSYTSANQILDGFDRTNAEKEIRETPPYSYYDSAEGAKIGDLASVIDVRYGGSEAFHNMYTYDPVLHTYERKSGGILTTDKATLEKVALSNVIFFEVNHSTIDKAGRQQLDLTSGGQAYLFQAGVMKEVEWQSIDGVLVPMDDGLPAKLVPGKTWIHLIPSKPGLESMVSYTP